jgi:hypothetical protein
MSEPAPRLKRVTKPPARLLHGQDSDEEDITMPAASQPRRQKRVASPTVPDSADATSAAAASAPEPIIAAAATNPIFLQPQPGYGAYDYAYMGKLLDQQKNFQLQQQIQEMQLQMREQQKEREEQAQRKQARAVWTEAELDSLYTHRFAGRYKETVFDVAPALRNRYQREWSEVFSACCLDGVKKTLLQMQQRIRDDKRRYENTKHQLARSGAGAVSRDDLLSTMPHWDVFEELLGANKKFQPASSLLNLGGAAPPAAASSAAAAHTHTSPADHSLSDLLRDSEAESSLNSPEQHASSAAAAAAAPASSAALPHRRAHSPSLEDKKESDAARSHTDSDSSHSQRRCKKQKVDHATSAFERAMLLFNEQEDARERQRLAVLKEENRAREAADNQRHTELLAALALFAPRAAPLPLSPHTDIPASASQSSQGASSLLGELDIEE